MDGVISRSTVKTIVGALIVVALVGPLPVCAQGDKDQSIQLLLQKPLEFDQPADRCEVEICRSLIALLDKARESIDFAIYGARNQSTVLEAISRAKERGIRVRGYVDRDAEGHNYYSSTNEWVQRIGNIRDDQNRESTCSRYFGKIDVKCPRPPGFKGPLQCSAFEVGDQLLLARHASREAITPNQIMHNKFFVVDGEWVWTGSANISDSGTGGYNANAVLLIRSKEMAGTYTREFEQLWDRTPQTCEKRSDGIEEFRIGTADITTWFSPQDKTTRYGVSGLIARAKDRINVAVFFLTSKHLTADLIAAHRRGVQVRVIIDATAAKNGYTKHELLREIGIPVKIENWGSKMHMKSASIDGQFLVTGSMNWTSAGEWANDENTLLIRSSRLTTQFDHYYDEIWNSIPNRWAEPGRRPDPESLVSGTSCFDEVDNDFDDQADEADPSCSNDPPPLPELPPHEFVSADQRSSVKKEGYRFVPLTKCDPSYPDWFVCLPASPWVRCQDIPYRRFRVLPPDPQSKDGNNNGLGCERRP